MPRKRSTLVDFTQYLAARGVMGLFHAFGMEQSLYSAGRIGSLLMRISQRHRERAATNLRDCFPDLAEGEIDGIVERSFQHMMQMFLVDAVVGPKLITPDGWGRYIHIGHMESTIDLIARQRPVIFISGHCGNWELLSSLMAVIGYPMAALARPLDNRFLNHWLLSMREARGTRIITKWGATPVVQEILRDSGRVAFIADQNAGDRGLFVPFFDRLASCYKSIALLAMRYQAPVVAGWARRLGGQFEYAVDVEDVIQPEEWSCQPDPTFYITARYARAIEMMVRRAPDQYLWVHRRWKSRPRHEREGRPFPPRLRTKLESLPWTTAECLDRIIARSDADAAAIRQAHSA